MTAPTPTPSRCERCGRPRGAVDDDGPNAGPRPGSPLCWRDTGCYGTTHAERDCYRHAYERTSERLRRLVEAVKAVSSTLADVNEHDGECALCRDWFAGSEDAKPCAEHDRMIAAHLAACEAEAALLADTDGGTTT